MKNILNPGGKREGSKGISPNVTVVLPRKMLDQLVDEAWKQRITKSELIRRYIDKGLKHDR